MQTLATELKASLRILQVHSNFHAARVPGKIPGLDEDVPVQQLQENFVHQVAQILEIDDLLVLTHNAYPFSPFAVSS